MKNQKVGYLYSLPALLFMIFFVGYPIFYNIILSIKNVDIMTFNKGTDQFVGLQNYKILFSDDLLTQSLYQTFYFTFFCIVFQFVFGFIFALFFRMEFTFSKPLRGLILVTWMIPMTVTGMLFKFMLSPGDGVINYLLLHWGITQEAIGFLISESSALWGVIFTNTWVGIPFNMILLTTGMSTIPSELYESANVDGAGPLRKFFWITLPLVKPAIMSMLMLGFIYTFKVFDLIFVMTGGGPLNATEVLSTVSYKYSFDFYDFSKGAAVANILFVILLAVSLVYLRILHKEDLE